MRRWAVTVFLLLVLPFQFVWAAAAPLCGHETQAGGKSHVGHHEHRHQGTEPASASATTDASSGDAGGVHPDCESCHLGSCAGLTSPVVEVAFVAQTRADGEHRAEYRSHIPYGPERPDRLELTAAARLRGGVEFRPLTS